MIGETAKRFMDELEEKIDYYRREYELSYGEAIMALEVVKLKIADEMFSEEEGEGE